MTVDELIASLPPVAQAPSPPAIDEPVARLVHSDVGLSELFVGRACAAQMQAELTPLHDLNERLVAFLRKEGCRRIALPAEGLVQKLGIPEMLRGEGFDIGLEGIVSLDDLYSFDCGITDVHAAVAETGSLVVRDGSPLSLVPPVHVAIVEPTRLVPDLLDLVERLGGQPPRDTALITGPSKTSDIEAVLVTGVHGPRVVKVFVLQ